MRAIQPINGVRFPKWCGLFAALAILLGLTACSDNAQTAAEQGAAAEAFLQAGDIPAARDAIREAIDARDDISDLHILRGRIEVAAGNNEAAYGAFYNAMSLDPLNMMALQGVSQIGLATGNLDESFDATERILSIAPNDPQALLVRGLHALARRRHEEALNYANRTLEVAPGQESAQILKARALFLEERREEALDAVGGWPRDETQPITPAIAQTRLEIFREQENRLGMEEEFRRLRGLRPDDADLRFDEANFRAKAGDREEAVELVFDALSEPELDDGEAAERAARAVRQWSEHGIPSIPAARWQALSNNAAQPVREIVARYLLLKGRYDLAGGFIASLDGLEKQALGAQLQVAQGDARNAFSVANRVLRQDATHCSALIAASQAARSLRRTQKAVELGQLAATECPDRPAAFDAAANAYTAWNRPTAAERIYAQGLDAMPQNLDLVRSYATWLLANGQDRQSVAIMRRYTRDNPSSVAAWNLYEEVCRKADRSCVAEAQRNASAASTRYGFDLPPGRLRPNGLFGRFVTRS